MENSMFKRPVSMDELIKASDRIAEAEEKFFKQESIIELEAKRLHYLFLDENREEILKKEFSEKSKHEHFNKYEKEYENLGTMQLDNKLLRSDITSLARRYDLMRDSFARDTRSMNR